MVGAVNPTANRTVKAYKTAAALFGAAGSAPDKVAGGTVEPFNSTSDGGSDDGGGSDDNDDGNSGSDDNGGGQGAAGAVGVQIGGVLLAGLVAVAFGI